MLPVVTWSGNSADIPQLQSAVQRLKLGKALNMIESRHLDLFQHARSALRFPIPGLGLGDLASYFAIPRVSRIGDGLQAQSMFLEYRSCQDDDRRDALKSDLVEYNLDDLEALVGVAEWIASQTEKGGTPPSRRVAGLKTKTKQKRERQQPAKAEPIRRPHAVNLTRAQAGIRFRELDGRFRRQLGGPGTDCSLQGANGRHWRER